MFHFMKLSQLIKEGIIKLAYHLLFLNQLLGKDNDDHWLIT